MAVGGEAHRRVGRLGERRCGWRCRRGAGHSRCGRVCRRRTSACGQCWRPCPPWRPHRAASRRSRASGRRRTAAQPLLSEVHVGVRGESFVTSAWPFMQPMISGVLPLVTSAFARAASLGLRSFWRRAWRVPCRCGLIHVGVRASGDAAAVVAGDEQWRDAIVVGVHVGVRGEQLRDVSVWPFLQAMSSGVAPSLSAWSTLARSRAAP